MKSQQGFILPLTLWILAAITIGIGIFAERMLSVLDLAVLSQQRIQNLIDIGNTRAEILFRLATTPMSVYGLGSMPNQTIALDNRPYRGDGQTLVRLQDDRGLLNLNIAEDDRIYRLLGVLGVPFEQRGRLIDTFNDYIDGDDFRRLNGAEAREYVAAGLPPPRNDKLLTPDEPRNILGWRDLHRLWQKDGLAELAVTGVSVGINPNTAPWQILATFPRVTTEAAIKMIELRAKTPIQTIDQAALLMGVPASSLFLQVILFPSDSIRVTQNIPGQNWALRYHVSFMPNGERAPWRIDHQYKIELPYQDENIGSIPPLPEKSTLPQNSGTSLLPF